MQITFIKRYLVVGQLSSLYRVEVSLVAELTPTACKLCTASELL